MSRRVTHVAELCRTYEMRCVPHTSETRHAFDTLNVRTVCTHRISHAAHIIMSHMLVCRVTHMHELCRTYETSCVALMSYTRHTFDILNVRPACTHRVGHVAHISVSCRKNRLANMNDTSHTWMGYAVYDRCHCKYCTPKIHRIQNLKFLDINSN